MHFTPAMYSKLILLFLICAGTGFAQDRWVTLGVKGGVSITETTRTSSTEQEESRRYIIGPTVEFRLPGNFAVEASALYQRVGGTSAFPFLTPLFPSGSFFLNRRRADTWQFPVLGKYYFNARSRSFQPFLGTGYAIRTGWAEDEGRTTAPGNQNTGGDLNPQRRNELNFLVGITF